MRLLNVKTMKLEDFFEETIPDYAILSHTWGKDEITFREFDPVLGPRRTSKKIDGCCTQTVNDGFDYVWIDTCCIDKSSSAELSEAINSMFAWYQRAEICYVYLSDVQSDQKHSSDFQTSRWFGRGWTLQELLAPRNLVFYNSSWCQLGCVAKQGSHRQDFVDHGLLSEIALVTKIPTSVISGSRSLNTVPIAARMSWASARQTTRIEDMAYSLLGIFDIAMPMLYGEGTKAFIRLQEEIIKNEDDLSILAWGFRGTVVGGASCFASSPVEFAGCGNLDAYTSNTTCTGHVAITNKGLNMEMSIIQLTTGDYIGRLAEDSVCQCLTIPLVRHKHGGNEAMFYRPPLNIPQLINAKFFQNIRPQSVYISKSASKLVSYRTGLRLSDAFLKEFEVNEIHPPNWDMSSGWLLLSLYENSEVQNCDQMILLGCSNKSENMFVIRIDYTFDVWATGVLRSKSVRLSVSPMVLSEGPYSSLLELILGEGRDIDKMLDWQADIVLKRLEPSGVNGSAQIRNRYTRRLHLDRKGVGWEIDVVDVRDSYGGADGVRNSLVSNEAFEYSDSDDSDRGLMST
jgi:hypothetical protein